MYVKSRKWPQNMKEAFSPAFQISITRSCIMVEICQSKTSGSNFWGSTERKGRAFSDPALVLSGMALLQDVMSSNFSQVRFKLSLPVNLRPKPFFPLQAKCIVINFHSYNVYLFGCLIFEPVSYLHYSTVTFLDLPGDYYGLRPKISLRILELSVLPFFPDQRGRA